MILFGVLEEVNGKILTISREDADAVEVNSDDVAIDFPHAKGDYLQLVYENDGLVEIVPSLRETFECEIVKLFETHGIVGEDTVFSIDGGEVYSVGQIVKCDRVKGEYVISDDGVEYSYRCIAIEKTEASEDTIAPTERVIQVNYEEQHCDIPRELRQLMLCDAKSQVIRAKLDELIPKDLNISTYKAVFHNLIHLDELNLLQEFNRHRREEASFQRKPADDMNPNVFQMEFEDLHEMRSSLLRGDRVEVTNIETKRLYHGIIRKCLLNNLDILLDEDFAEEFDEATTYSVEFFYSRGIFKKMHCAIDRAVDRLGQKFFFPNEIRLANTAQIDAQLGDDDALIANGVNIPWFKQDIDASQKAAVVQALRAQFRPMPTIIHGPPGTGKTTTLIEIILQVFTQLPNSRILVAAHSNSAANLILSQLLDHDFVHESIVRVLGVCYQEKNIIGVELHPYCVSVDTLKSELTEKNNKCDIRILEDLRPLAPYRIVIGTCIGLGKFLYDRANVVPDYSHVIVDEAGQCSEPEVAIPISKVNIENGCVILAGDPMQMPPLVLSKYARERGLSLSLLERFVQAYTRFEGELNGKESHADVFLISKLLYNYRSIPSLLNFYNKHFYDNELLPTVSDTDSPEAEMLALVQKLVPLKPNQNLKHAIFFHNVLGKNRQLTDSNSWYNQEEAIAVTAVVANLKRQHFSDEDIGVITPYHLQVKTLRKVFEAKYPGIKVGSVDEYQGLEKAIIIISTVRTDTKKVKNDIIRKLGIVACPKRINVAVSRARAAVVVIGRADLLKKDPYWADLIAACSMNGTFYET